MLRTRYTGDKRREISFPLGGIGAGAIGLDGTGRLRDFEIFNRPNKGGGNGFTHFAVKAERNGKVIDARAAQADLMPPYTGRIAPGAMYSEYGFGPSRHLLCGVPHFKDSAFIGRFPLAEVEFLDDTFPGKVTLRAFSPLIPLDDKNSSLPAAFFTLLVENTTDAPLDYTAALTLGNPFEGRRVNTIRREDGSVVLALTGAPGETSDPKYGQLAMATPDCEGLSFQEYWYRGNWFDNLGVFWRDFTAGGDLKNRTYPPSPERGGEDAATLAVRKRVAPGEVYEARFVIAWYFPNCTNYWSESATKLGDANRWTNYYATLFDSAADVSRYALANWNSLEVRTRRFEAALTDSTLPDEALEALAANLSVLKSPTCLRLTDGSFYAFEGCHCASGCCEGSCTHVWNYAFALPYLFPKLERSMRELDYRYNLGSDGDMPFRIQLPLGSPRWKFRACVDGQMGGVIKTYREWKISGDDAWLRSLWPSVKSSLEYAWSPNNKDLWDPDMSGVITGRQHHTLDMELFGPNAWLNSFYLAALKAAAEMAQAVGERGCAITYRELYEKGRAYTDRELFNGEYYVQKVDIRDPHVLDPYESGDTLTGGGTREVYWNDEAGQLKYQIVDGCGIDQVLAQWMADLTGLGDILDRDQVKSALAAIYRHNFKESFRDHFNPCRIFGLNDESGLTICSWPEGREKPVVPIPYAEESMHGFEYQAACHMIGRGLPDEGLRVIRSIRDRYDGEKRNPWNEFECGSNYARSMASYALLNTYAGFTCDMTHGAMGFHPIEALNEHRYFFSIEGAWGVFQMDGQRASLRVVEGQLNLKSLSIPDAARAAKVRVAGEEAAFAVEGGAITLDATVEAGRAIEIDLI